jgi:hypothetical protein
MSSSHCPSVWSWFITMREHMSQDDEISTGFKNGIGSLFAAKEVLINLQRRYIPMISTSCTSVHLYGVVPLSYVVPMKSSHTNLPNITQRICLLRGKRLSYRHLVWTTIIRRRAVVPFFWPLFPRSNPPSFFRAKAISATFLFLFCQK